MVGEVKRNSPPSGYPRPRLEPPIPIPQPYAMPTQREYGRKSQAELITGRWIFENLAMAMGAKNASAYADGSATGGVAEAITEFEGAEGVLYASPKAYPFDSNYTIPSNIHLCFGRGAIFTIATGVTLTINGTMPEDPLSQRFNCVGTGTVVFGDGSVARICPEWWGIDGTNDHLELEKAFDAAALAKIVIFSQLYNVTVVPTVAVGASIQGLGRHTGINATGCDGISFDGNGSVPGTFYKDFAILGDGTASIIGLNVPGTNTTAYILQGPKWDNIYINNFETAVHLRTLRHATFDHIVAYDVKRGIDIAGMCVDVRFNNLFFAQGSYANAGSRGISVDGFTYDEGLRRSESITFKDPLIFGFESGAYWWQCNLGQIIRPTLDDCTKYGIHFMQSDGGLTIRDGWVSIRGASALYGIYGITLGSSQDGIALISHMKIFAYDSPHADSVGIRILGNQDNTHTEHNHIDGFQKYDIEYANNANARILYNKCLSTTPTYSLYMDTCTKHMEHGNEFAGSVFFSAGTRHVEEQEAWITPSLLNSWADFGGGYPPARYFKDNFRIVHLKGLVKDGTGMGTVIFTLPAAYRPAEEHFFAVASNNAFGFCSVTVAGEVKAIVGSTSWFSLAGITFRVD